ncbi:MAG: hypothetical protein BroJett018_24350 [Chloroflexota bacterium]|nr:MAG: hypothetical protein BroJett018_24350 [Chloroflexota bacterium]
MLDFETWVNGLTGRQKFYFFVTVLAICIPLYLYGSSQQLANINNRNYWVDQDAYINYARRLAESNYTYIGDFNRMPLYPYLVSFLYEDGLSEEDYFERAKVFNIGLSVALLVMLMVVLATSFDNLSALNLWLLAAFMIYIFKSAYIQVELTFYTFYFFAFILMLKLLVRPSWKLAIVTGVWLGVCHLTKNSVLPGIAILTAFLLLRVLLSRAALIGQRMNSPAMEAKSVETDWGSINSTNKPVYFSRLRLNSLRVHSQARAKPFGGNMGRVIQQLAPIVLLLVTFLAVIFPYIRTAKNTFGHYFYNVNTTFYIWYDSWEEAEAGVRLHGDYYQWPDMPADEIPSPQKYLREHSLEQIARRFIYGFYVSAQRHTYSGGYGYIWYLLAYIGMALWLVRRTLKSEQRIALLRKMREYRLLLLFLATFFTAYLFLFAFYVEIHPGQRFMLTLFLPAMYCLTMLLHLPIFRTLTTHIGSREVATVRVFNVVIFGALVTHGLLNAVYAAGVIHGGG